MGKIGNWLRGLIGLVVVIGLAAALAWLLRGAMQLAGPVSEEPTSPIVTTPQPTWTPPTEQELRRTVVTPDAPAEVAPTQAGSTPLPTSTFPPSAPTATPGPPTAEATPLPTWPSPIVLEPVRPEGVADLTTILFWRNEEPVGFFLLTLDKTESGVEQKIGIPQDPFKACVDVGTMRASPTQDQLVYVVGLYGPGDSDGGEIWTARLDGSEARQLVAPTEQFYPADPIWSPDGKQVAYVMVPHPLHAEPEANMQLWVMGADGGDPRMVSQDPTFSPGLVGGKALLFFWADDGYIYFINYKDKMLYALNPESGQTIPLLENAPLPFDMALAPSGRQIAVTTEELAIKMKHTIIPAVFTGGANLLWSPDGRQIAFTVYEPEKRGNARTPGLWIRNIQTGDERLLIGSESLSRMLVRPEAWSPDSRALAYLTTQGIWVANLETQESKLIVPDPRPEGGGVGIITWGW